eukprot:gnl/Trimastix_PCT/1404.p1 GENE.gnl/Trimastix_PCT/1404~~gnl/Trimastix_PCT/1404.p1  ORF type:complete len:359 (+),score=54.79 gnl/Trimastix_PCT/1404:54-1130(+)
MTTLSLTGEQNEILFLCFNQDQTIVSCGTKFGFRSYYCDPFSPFIRNEFPGENIHLVEMLFHNKTLALVGDGGSLDRKTIVFWEDVQQKAIAQRHFEGIIRGVRLRRDRLIVVLDTKVIVSQLHPAQQIAEIPTRSNPRGLCAVSSSTEQFRLAVPSPEVGQVLVEQFLDGPAPIEFTLNAHENHIACLALNVDGSRLATASEKGTLVRIFNLDTRELVREVRRGTEAASVHAMCFSHDSHWLAVSSDRGTVHVFALTDQGASINPTSKLSILKRVVPYFGSEWSFAQFRLSPHTASICGFSPDSHFLYVVTSEGHFYKLEIPAHPGPLTPVFEHCIAERPRVSSPSAVPTATPTAPT